MHSLKKNVIAILRDCVKPPSKIMEIFLGKLQNVLMKGNGKKEAVFKNAKIVK